MKKSTTPTEQDLKHKIRAQLIQLYEASAGISYPSSADIEFRNRVAEKLAVADGVQQIVRRHLGLDDDTLISAAQVVRLYKSNAAIKNPDVPTAAFRRTLEAKLGDHFVLGVRPVAGAASKDAGKN